MRQSSRLAGSAWPATAPDADRRTPDSEASLDVIRQLAYDYPILSVRIGHQTASGAEDTSASCRHGKICILRDRISVFEEDHVAVQHHAASLLVERNPRSWLAVVAERINGPPAPRATSKATDFAPRLVLARRKSSSATGRESDHGDQRAPYGDACDMAGQDGQASARPRPPVRTLDDSRGRYQTPVLESVPSPDEQQVADAIAARPAIGSGNVRRDLSSSFVCVTTERWVSSAAAVVARCRLW